MNTYMRLYNWLLEKMQVKSEEEPFEPLLRLSRQEDRNVLRPHPISRLEQVPLDFRASLGRLYVGKLKQSLGYSDDVPILDAL